MFKMISKTLILTGFLFVSALAFSENEDNTVDCDYVVYNNGIIGFYNEPSLECWQGAVEAGHILRQLDYENPIDLQGEDEVEDHAEETPFEFEEAPRKDVGLLKIRRMYYCDPDAWFFSCRWRTVRIHLDGTIETSFWGFSYPGP